MKGYDFASYIEKLDKHGYAERVVSRVHLSKADWTLCRKELNSRWIIHSGAGMDIEDVTCPKCKAEFIRRNK